MKPVRLTIREYAESLAVAFVLAMIIRHFVVEAFRIPTSSMEPTLIGREPGGDRILVSKFQFDLHPPRPWDVIVFKIDQRRIDFYRSRFHPSNTRQLGNGMVEHPGSAEYVNYVKRLIALPGQTVEVRNGDVFINGKISRKPERVENVLLVPVTNDELLKQSGETFFPRWGRHPEDAVSMLGDSILLAGSAGSGNCEVRYQGSTEDRKGDVVGDLKIGFRFKHVGGSGRLVGRLVGKGREYAFHLPLGRQAALAELRIDGEMRARANKPFDAAGEHRIEFSSVDARAVLQVDGNVLISFDDDNSPDARAATAPLTDRHETKVEFGVAGCDVAVRDVRLWRDIYYTADREQQIFAVGKPFTLAKDEYFVLGDNSPNSFDSRCWGVVRQSNLTGEAFFVFWPVPRWKCIN